MKKEMVKVTVNISAEMVKRVDEYAGTLDLNRTASIKLLLNYALNYKDAIELMVGPLPEVPKNGLMEGVSKEHSAKTG